MDPVVIAVSAAADHNLSKRNHDSITLLAGIGVQGDAHAGKTVKHRSRVAQDPTQPNLRQVHLIPAELHDELRAAGFNIRPGQMGENITTQDVDLLSLPQRAWLRIGQSAVVEITGLRTPCAQLNELKPGLMSAVLSRDDAGDLVRRAGVMGIVVADGEVRPGDAIRIELPNEPHRPLGPV